MQRRKVFHQPYWSSQDFHLKVYTCTPIMWTYSTLGTHVPFVHTVAEKWVPSLFGLLGEVYGGTARFSEVTKELDVTEQRNSFWTQDHQDVLFLTPHYSVLFHLLCCKALLHWPDALCLHLTWCKDVSKSEIQSRSFLAVNASVEEHTRTQLWRSSAIIYRHYKLSTHFVETPFMGTAVETKGWTL